MHHHGLGRIHVPDPRDAAYPVEALLATLAPEEKQRTSRYWGANGWWGDQGQKPECVAYAWCHWLEDGPIGHPGPAPCVDPDALYQRAKQLDGSGGAGDGTSVRAAAKALVERGFVGAYHWATTVDSLAAAVLALGPVVVGTNWYEGMFTPDASGQVHINGALAGGHAWVIDGIDTGAQVFRERLFRAKNSWGREWGKKGFFYVDFDTMTRLLAESGEACLATELRPKIGVPQ